MDKPTLRKVYLEKRKFLSQTEYERRSRLLYQQLVHYFENKNPRNIHSFIPIKRNKETDLWPFLHYLWSQRKEVEVLTAISDLKQPKLTHVKITPSTSFIENKWGIPEPQAAEKVEESSIQYVLVPMIVGSKSGYRVGYGKGYYDRFLAACSPDAVFIGISLSPFLDGDLYADEFDVPMDIMINPFEILTINHKK